MIVNYRGQIKGGRTDAFFGDLRRDLDAGVFSYVSFDGDDEDVVRVVKSAARDDFICGEFFISYPDFEFANFISEELEEIIWNMTTESATYLDGQQEYRSRLRNALRGRQSGEELVRAAQETLRPGFREPFSKGERWGQHLMEHAMKRPRFPNGEDRQLIKGSLEGTHDQEFQLSSDAYPDARRPGDRAIGEPLGTELISWTSYASAIWILQ